MKYVGKSSRRLTVIFSRLIAFISSVMQNTGAAVLFLPAIRLVASYRLKIPISRVLMPIGMAAILGGTMTMIGTSPLILLNDILPAGMPKFSFLELTPIGLAIGLSVVYSTFPRRHAHAGQASTRQTAGTGRSPANGAERGYPQFLPENQRPLRNLCARTILTRGPASARWWRFAGDLMVNIVASAKIRQDTCEIAPLPETSHPSRLYVLCAYGPKRLFRFCEGLRPDPEG